MMNLERVIISYESVAHGGSEMKSKGDKYITIQNPLRKCL